jgi:hypothetical protein
VSGKLDRQLAYFQENLKHIRASSFTKEIKCVMLRVRCCGTDKLVYQTIDQRVQTTTVYIITHEEESKIEIGDRCPSKEELNGIVDKFELHQQCVSLKCRPLTRDTYLQDDLAEEILTRCPNPEEEYGGVD